MMKLLKIFGAMALLLLFACNENEPILDVPEPLLKQGKAEDEGLNNLSFPVIWAEGVTKSVPGTPGVPPVLEGVWWYYCGVDVNGDPESAPSDTENPDPEWVRAYVQKDAANVWQAESADATDPVMVDALDWGDNLEAVDWNVNSQVRVEMVLYEDLGEETMTGYEMAHVSGSGTDEIHGLVTDQEGTVQFVDSDVATVYTTCARLTIQKFNTDPSTETELTWNGDGYWVGDDINEPLFNKAVHEAVDGPGDYSAETNVKGMIIFGYNWNLKNDNEGAGYYRITFSLDDKGTGECPLNTFLDEAEILVADEEEEAPYAAGDDGGDTGGGVAVLDAGNNLTYIDIHILEKTTGGGGKR